MNKRSLCFVLTLFVITNLSFAYYANAANPNAAISISTNKVKYVGIITATCGGNITYTNSDPIISAGVCWSKNPLPTVNDPKQLRVGTNDSFTCVINTLSPKTGYYIRAFVETSAGVVYGAQRTFATDSARLGMNILGGDLFYMFKPGDVGYVEGEFHGLIATKRIGLTIAWNNGIDTLIGATDSTILSGKVNTQKIVNVLGAGNYPAKICSDLVQAGYDDWYLPSFHEVILMANAGFSSGPTWSSTEASKTQAYYVSARKARLANKTQRYYVQAVRSF